MYPVVAMLVGKAGKDRSKNSQRDKSGTPNQCNYAVGKRGIRNERGGSFSLNMVSFLTRNWVICLETDSVSWALTCKKFFEYFTFTQKFPETISEQVRVFGNLFLLFFEFAHHIVITVFLMRRKTRTQWNAGSQGLLQPGAAKINELRTEWHQLTFAWISRLDISMPAFVGMWC